MCSSVWPALEPHRQAGHGAAAIEVLIYSAGQASQGTSEFAITPSGILAGIDVPVLTWLLGCTIFTSCAALES